MKRILVTGGAGFIGSNFIRMALESRLTELGEIDLIVNLDKLTYAGNLANLENVENDSRYYFVKGDICDRALVKQVIEKHKVTHIINFAAESHVDRSIMDSSPFVETNISGTVTLLDSAKGKDIRYLQVSTDEVYGSLGDTGLFTEETPLDPRSPYSASKASADTFVRAYHETFGMDTIITRCSNNYGPFQFPEKLIPLMTINAMSGKKLPLYGDGLNVRDWIHVEDHCRGIALALEKGESGEVYNFGGESEKTNKEIVGKIIEALGAEDNLIEYVKDRPGHDRRYAIDNSKSKNKLGFSPQVSFEKGIEDTIRWYQQNEEWWKSIISGDYQNYYKENYSDRQG